MKTNIPFTFILLSLIGFAWFIDSYTRERPSELDCVEVVEYFLDHEDEINFPVDHAIRILQRSLNFEDYKNEQLEVDGILGNKTIQKYRNYTNSIKTERE